MDKFVDLVDYLKRESRDDFYLSFERIEEIIGQPLAKSAKTYPAYWSADGVHHLATLILECGFKVSPDLANQRIRLYRFGSNNASPKHGLISTKKAKPSKRREGVPAPTVDEVNYWLKVWDELEDYSAQETAVNRVFRDYSSNSVLENILIKCSVLNDFYSTNIFKIYPVAKHILALNIDERLKRGDPTLVDEIAINEIGGKTKYFYSFASKYCSHHNQLNFPIYDSYVHKVLVYFKKVDMFFDFNESDLKVYPKFKNILIQFRAFYKLEQFNLKELDKFLWQFGKRYFPKNY